MRTVARIGLVAAVPLLLAWTLYTPELGNRSQMPTPVAPGHSQITITAHTKSSSPEVSGQEQGDADGPVDLLGNEVTDAVAKYKFDATGSLYETHSPQTELPRLSSPKS